MRCWCLLLCIAHDISMTRGFTSAGGSQPSVCILGDFQNDYASWPDDRITTSVSQGKCCAYLKTQHHEEYFPILYCQISPWSMSKEWRLCITHLHSNKAGHMKEADVRVNTLPGSAHTTGHHAGIYSPSQRKALVSKMNISQMCSSSATSSVKQSSTVRVRTRRRLWPPSSRAAMDSEKILLQHRHPFLPHSSPAFASGVLCLLISPINI